MNFTQRYYILILKIKRNINKEKVKMELSHGELMVMEMLWDGECLDDNGEIQALELSKLLHKKYGMGKTTEIFN